MSSDSIQLGIDYNLYEALGSLTEEHLERCSHEWEYIGNVENQKYNGILRECEVYECINCKEQVTKLGDPVLF